MASRANISQELEHTKKLLADAEEMLERQSREIAALMMANEAKSAELEALRAKLRSDELLQSMRNPPTTLESGRTLEDAIRHWGTR